MLIKEIWRYPVKSMAGEQLDAADITEHGIAGDRIFQVRNASGRIFSARTRPELLRHKAVLKENGDVLVEDAPGIQLTSLSMSRRQQAREPASSAATQMTASMCSPCWS
jgi:uncharacterized protein YcbX